MTLEEIKSVVDAARDYGFKVAAHAHGSEGIIRAVKAGVDSIEHGTLMDAEGMTLMRKEGAYYVPTLLAGAWVAEKALIEDYYPPFVQKKALEHLVRSQVQQGSLKTLLAYDNRVLKSQFFHSALIHTLI